MLSLRPLLPCLLAPAAALTLAACGSSAKGLLTGGQASALNGQLSQISAELAGGQCTRAIRDAASFATNIANLPSSVNPTLQQDLQQGAQTIDQLIPHDCSTKTTTTATATATTSTQATTSAPTTGTTAPPTTTAPPATTTATTPAPAPGTATATTPGGGGTSGNTNTGSGGAGLGGGSTSTSPSTGGAGTSGGGAGGSASSGAGSGSAGSGSGGGGGATGATADPGGVTATTPPHRPGKTATGT